MTPDAMLFFGNLPLTYQTKELAKLASSYGVINRCLVIHSKMTKKSKGYGFVEYANRNHAMQVGICFYLVHPFLYLKIFSLEFVDKCLLYYSLYNFRIW